MSFRSWLTGEAAPKTVPPQPQAERDWFPGNRAKCIAKGYGWRCPFSGELVVGPAKGQVLRVIAVRAGYGTLWLEFVGFVGAFPAGHFRKLRPCTLDFREQMRRRSPSPAEPRRTDRPVPELVP